MNNISFKGFYQVEPIGNKKTNMKLASELIKTIPNTVFIGYTGSNAKTVFIPEENEIQFEKLSEALKAKSLVYIEKLKTKLPTIHSLLTNKIRDFEPSPDSTYVALSADVLKAFLDTNQQKLQDKTQNNGVFNIGLFDYKFNIPEIIVTQSKEPIKETVNPLSQYRIQIPNSSKEILSSFLKLGYSEIPVKLNAAALGQIEKMQEETGINLVSRTINVMPIEK